MNFDIPSLEFALHNVLGTSFKKLLQKYVCDLKSQTPNSDPDFATMSPDQDIPPRLVEHQFHSLMAQAHQSVVLF